MKRTLSLRSKFTLALLACSLLSLVAAGYTARLILFHEFSSIVMQKAFQRFCAEMTIYIDTYGSWEAAQHAESFPAFQKRRQHQSTAAANRFRLPANAVPPNQPVIQHQNEIPPFRFALSDLRGKVLMGGGHFKIGSMAPSSLLDQAKPIRIDGKIVALALPDPKPNFNELDRAYLQAIRAALIIAGITGIFLALALGLVIGTRLNRTVLSLTNAIQAMQRGDLRQRVDVDSDDEIGDLTTSFNLMSAQLAEAHEELEKSNLQIKEQAQQLRELCIRDELTGLYNRRHFNEQARRLFAESTRYGHPLTVIIGDIDLFKKINDTFSHATGDQVLQRVSNLLQSNTRSADVLARYGGEEFVLILPHTTLLDAADLCEKLRMQIETYSWEEIDPDLHVTMSFGLSADTTQGNFEKQLALADDKLHLAKSNGRNRICFDTQERDESSETKVLS